MFVRECCDIISEMVALVKSSYGGKDVMHSLRLFDTLDPVCIDCMEFSRLIVALIQCDTVTDTESIRHFDIDRRNVCVEFVLISSIIDATRVTSCVLSNLSVCAARRTRRTVMSSMLPNNTKHTLHDTQHASPEPSQYFGTISDPVARSVFAESTLILRRCLLCTPTVSTSSIQLSRCWNVISLRICSEFARISVCECESVVLTMQ